MKYVPHCPSIQTTFKGILGGGERVVPREALAIENMYWIIPHKTIPIQPTIFPNRITGCPPS